MFFDQLVAGNGIPNSTNTYMLHQQNKRQIDVLSSLPLLPFYLTLMVFATHTLCCETKEVQKDLLQCSSGVAADSNVHGSNRPAIITVPFGTGVDPRFLTNEFVFPVPVCAAVHRHNDMYVGMSLAYIVMVAAHHIHRCSCLWIGPGFLLSEQ